MATSAQAFAALARLSPEEALAYLKARGQITQSWSWADLWQEEHTQQFTVSRLANVDLLKDVQALITASVNGDMGRKNFMRDAKAALEAKGWWGEKTVIDQATGRELTTTFNPERLKLIFDTNTRQAYAAGQWERIQASKRSHPYLRYITKGDERVRASHAAWNNVTLPVDDSFWHTHTPPNAWRCRCRIVSVSQREYDLGKTPNGAAMRKTAPEIQLQDWTNPRTGEISQIPKGVHPAFAYNPGIARKQNLDKVAQEKVALLPEPLQRAWAAQTQQPNQTPKRQSADLQPQAYLDKFDSLTPKSIKTAGAVHNIDAGLFSNTKTGELKITKRGRGEFVEYYADTAQHPTEVWESAEIRRDTGEMQTVRRFLKSYSDGTLVVLVFTKQGNVFVGTSAFAAFDGKGLPDISYYGRQRTGNRLL